MTRIELVTLSLPRIRSADWATSAYEIGCGGRTWTSDLRVMSPTSYQLLHPAISVVVRVGFEPTKRNAADLQSAPFSHSGTSPLRQKELYIILNVLSIKKLLDFSRSLLFQLVAAHGFEPRTLRVWTACSSQLSYAAKLELMTRIELVTLSLPRIRSADWATSAYEIGCGGRTWTSDLRVMSPTSYQLLHPAISVVVRVGFEPTKRNAADLQSAPFSHSGTSPLRQEILYCIIFALSTLFCQLFSQLGKLKRRRILRRKFLELARGIEPPTCWLQVSCSAYWATPASYLMYYNVNKNLCQLPTYKSTNNILLPNKYDNKQRQKGYIYVGTLRTKVRTSRQLRKQLQNRLLRFANHLRSGGVSSLINRRCMPQTLKAQQSKR